MGSFQIPMTEDAKSVAEPEIDEAICMGQVTSPITTAHWEVLLLRAAVD